MDWEKIFANDAMNKVNLQNIQTAHTTQCRKKKSKPKSRLKI